jgi:hypothetical protein
MKKGWASFGLLQFFSWKAQRTDNAGEEKSLSKPFYC